MKILAVCLALAGITCAQYLAMSAGDSAVFSAWMSGWFNQKKGYVFVDPNAYARNVANVKGWCAAKMLSAMTSAARAQVVVDLSLITCKQLLELDQERQTLVSSWMAGYFSASKKNLNVV